MFDKLSELLEEKCTNSLSLGTKITEELFEDPEFKYHPKLKVIHLPEDGSAVLDFTDDFTFVYCFDFLISKAQLPKETTGKNET